MRIAVISDVHANLDSFLAVLADIDASNVDTVICLGDNVGYGPEPQAVIELVREKNIPTVMGNHEMAIADPRHLNWFNPSARISSEITYKLLAEDTIHYISDLDYFIVQSGCRFVHGFPPASANTYLFQASEFTLKRTIQKSSERLCFVGHTHDLEIVGFDGDILEHSPLTKGCLTLSPETKYIINVGSVGQPRDGDNNAKYVIWDSETDILDVRFVPYDIEQVVKKIIREGFPEINALRLW